MVEDPKFLPDIDEYLEIIDENAPVNARHLEELIYKIRASTGLNKDICTILVTLFFQEIRKQMLRGNSVMLKDFGKFLINRNHRKIFPKFKPAKLLRKKLNGRHI